MEVDGWGVSTTGRKSKCMYVYVYKLSILRFTLGGTLKQKQAMVGISNQDQGTVCDAENPFVPTTHDLSAHC